MKENRCTVLNSCSKRSVRKGDRREQVKRENGMKQRGKRRKKMNECVTESWVSLLQRITDIKTQQIRKTQPGLKQKLCKSHSYVFII